MTILTPKSEQPEISSYREDLWRKLAPEIKSMRKGDIMNGILKIVEYEVHIITFHKYFMSFTHTYQVNCVRCRNPLMVKDTDVVYIALLKTTSVCTFVANKSHRSTKAVILHFLIVCVQ